jgi:hypothetical protein
LTDKFYTTEVPLTSGVYYSFKVTAKNAVGDSEQSAVLAVLAATYPDAPINVQNVPSQTTAY